MKLAIYHYGSKTYFNLPEPTLMHKETVIKYHHLKDQAIDEVMIKKIKEDNQYFQILDKALKKLSLKPYTKKALKDKLEGPHHVIDQVVFECEKLGYINDLKLIEIYIDDFKNSTLSLKNFKEKMMKKGFSKMLLEETLSHVEIDQIDRAKLEAKKALKSYKALPYLKIKEKLTHHLIRKGYDYQDTERVIKNVLDDYEIDETTLLKKELIKEKTNQDIQKLTKKYLQKGYRYETIKDVLKGRFDERD